MWGGRDMGVGVQGAGGARGRGGNSLVCGLFTIRKLARKRLSTNSPSNSPSEN